ncbi:iron-sulfur cluster assembly 2 homolog, mitochondrial-like [Sycon ciliatum]|uniref:iron-sulfur cluster assembly 2 homolog, mitochondrial-like n=1 Tax=Sycon ciliatum TaxID=27933 RepID=UPI0020A9B6D8|eukprot:scpid43662/ scgid10766/ Iron-sulfur cluster assembly 2 homolog, mitochondrial; HESB-like domain-containing protein 1
MNTMALAFSSVLRRSLVSGLRIRQLCSNSSPVALTEQCVAQLKKISGDNEHLRVSVDGGGCSGWQYKFTLDSTVNEDDLVIEEQGVKVLVDTVSLDVMKGSKIDYQQELIRSAFVVIDNPQAEQGCSCGVSFSLKI